VGEALLDALDEAGDLTASAESLARSASRLQAARAQAEGLPAPQPIPEWLARACLAQLESAGAVRHCRMRRLAAWPEGGKGAVRWEQAANAYELLMPPRRGIKPRRRRRPAQAEQGPNAGEEISAESESDSDLFLLCPPGAQPPVAIWTMWLALYGQYVETTGAAIERQRQLGDSFDAYLSALPQEAREGRAGPH
jgi:hypothetical protein